ncbi:hypothetical protein ACTFIV_007791 [Dictyostelium citrinum]
MLQILEHIHQNFDFILKEGNGGILTIQEFKDILKASLEYGNIKISQFLFQITTITKEEFDQHSNEKSKFFFSNKFKK